jgi:predicted metal-binding membrane protein
LASAVTLASRPSLRNLQAVYRRRHPEWWVGLLIAFSWFAVIASHAKIASLFGSMTAHSPVGFGRAFLDWSLMVFAMMTPLALPSLQFTALNSLRFRRRRAMLIFLVTYTAIWLGFGIVALTGDRLFRAGLGASEGVLLAYALTLAACWQVSGPKRRALIACGRSVPLRPTRVRADISCARYAVQQAWRCLRSCWALMLVMVAAGPGGLVWMVVLSVLIAVEELSSIGQRIQRSTAVIMMVVGAGLLAVHVLT